MTIIGWLDKEDFRGIDFIYRFPKIPIVQRESVSKHSWWVVMLTRMLLDELLIKDKFQGQELEKYYQFCYETLGCAAFSDYNEIISGDVDHTVKYNEHNGEIIRDALDEYIDIELKSRFGERSVIYELSSTPIKPIKTILKVADWAALAKQIFVEYSLSNKNIYPVYKTTHDKMLKAVDACQKSLLLHFGEEKINVDYFVALKEDIETFIKVK